MTTYLDDTQGLEETLSDFRSKISYEQYRVERSGGDDATLESVKRNKHLYLQEAKQAILHWVDTEIIGKDVLAYDTPDITPHLLDLMEYQNCLRDEQRQTLIHHGYKQNTKEVK
jgi:hypothetical protein